MDLSLSEFPHVQRWLETMQSSPAVKTGMAILTPEFKSKYGTIAE